MVILIALSQESHASTGKATSLTESRMYSFLWASTLMSYCGYDVSCYISVALYNWIHVLIINRFVLFFINTILFYITICFFFSEFNTTTLNLPENFCRNPDKRPSGPWCFSSDPTVRTEKCAVPKCGMDP